nr:MAG TPA: hypothetical protein [Caudoviricetes sp.]
MTDSPRRCPVAVDRWRGVAMASPRSGRGGRPSSRPGCWCDGGGILRPGSLSSLPSVCFCFSSIYNKVYIII